MLHSNVPADRLCFFSGSADKKPGKGTGEFAFRPADYSELAGVPHWRRTLSNFHVHPFTCDITGEVLPYRTVEHAFQAAKIHMVDPEAARAFGVESGTYLGTEGDGLEARKQRKMRRLNEVQLAVWDARSAGVMARAQEAKFRQCPEARRVLLATGTAELWHHVPRGRPVRFEHLERLRATLRASSAACAACSAS